MGSSEISFYGVKKPKSDSVVPYKYIKNSTEDLNTICHYDRKKFQTTKNKFQANHKDQIPNHVLVFRLRPVTNSSISNMD